MLRSQEANMLGNQVNKPIIISGLLQESLEYIDSHQFNTLFYKVNPWGELKNLIDVIPSAYRKIEGTNRLMI